MNRFFMFVWTILGPIIRFVHPLDVRGRENLPKNKVLLCANHSSNWDPVLIAISLPIDYHLWAMAKESLFHVPVLNWIIKKLGAFPVSRGGNDIQSVRTALKVLKAGDNLLIFPEGKRVKQQGEVPAKGGVAMIGIRTGAVFIPVFVDRKKPWFRKMRVIFGEPYRPEYTGRHGTSEEIQAIADEVLRRAYALGQEESGEQENGRRLKS